MKLHLMEPESTSITLYDANQLPDGSIASIVDKIRDQVSSLITSTRAYELLEDKILRHEREVKLIENSLEEKERNLEKKSELLEAREKELQEKLELFEKERRSFVVIDEEITRKLSEFDEKSEIYEKKESFIKAKEADIKAVEEDVDNRIIEIRALEKKMNVREKWLKQLSENLGLKDKEIRDRDKELESRVILLSRRDLEIQKQEKEIAERVQELSEKISLKDEEFNERDKELESRFRLLSERELKVEKQEKEIKKRVQELKLRKNGILGREKETELKEKRLEERSREFDLQNKNRLKELELKETQLEAHRKEVDLEYEKLVNKCGEVDLKEINVEERFKQLDLENKKLLERLEDLKSKEKEVELESRKLLDLSEKFEFENEKFLDRSKRLESKEKQYIEERKKFEVEKLEFLSRSQEIELKANQCEELIELKDKQLNEQHKRFEVEKLEFQHKLKEIELLLELKDKQFDELCEKFEVERLQSEHQSKEIESMATQDNELLQKAEINIIDFKDQVQVCEAKQKQLEERCHDLEAEKKKFQEQLRVVGSQNMMYLDQTKELESRETKRLDEKGGEADEEEKRIAETLKACVTKESPPKRKHPPTDASIESSVNASSAVAFKKRRVSSSSSWPKKNVDPVIKEPKSESNGVSTSLEPQTQNSLMVTENGENLKLLLNQCPPPLVLYDALKKTCDHSKHVLHIIREECAFSLTGNKDPDLFALARCTLLLTQLRKLSPSIEPQLKEAAKEFAVDWRTSMEKKKANPLEVRCFLQFLASYGLASCFDAFQLLTLADPDHWRKLAPEFRQLLDLEEKFTSFIQRLIEKDDRVKAVKYMSALNYFRNFSPAKLLHEQLNYSIKKHKLLRENKKSIGSRMLSLVNEMQEVKEVEKCMADCGVRSNGLSSRVKLRIKKLEKLIQEKSRFYENSNGRNQPRTHHSSFNDSIASHTPSPVAQPRPKGGNKHRRLCGPSEFPSDSSLGHPGQLPRQHPLPNFVARYLDLPPRHYTCQRTRTTGLTTRLQQPPMRYIRDDFKGEVEYLSDIST